MRFLLFLLSGITPVEAIFLQYRCREQRVTALCVGILSGAAVLMTGVLRVGFHN